MPPAKKGPSPLSPFVRFFTTVSGFTFLSRIFGYVRECLIAAALGAGVLSDVFFLSFKLPNLFRRLFAEGAFNVSFIPLFSKLYHQDQAKAFLFLRQAFSCLLVLLLVLVIVFEICMPWILQGIAPGFKDMPGKMEQALLFARIAFPYILFISLAAFFSGILNSLNKFAAASSAPILLNISAITALLLVPTPALLASTALIWSVPIAGILQFLWVWMAYRRLHFPRSLTKPTLSAPVKTLFRKMGPGLFGAGIYQINMFVSDIIASFIPAAISYISFADRINQLPLSLIGATLGTILLPLLSKAIAQGKIQEVHHMQSKALGFSLFLSLPAAAALFLLAEPMVTVLYQRGCFTPEAATATAACLSAFVLGLPAYVLVKVLGTHFFARGDTRTPVISATISIVLNVLLNLLFIRSMGAPGIALATSCAYWANVFILGGLLHRQKHLKISRELGIQVVKIFVSTSLLVTFLLYGTEALRDLKPLASLLFLITGGLCIYLGSAYVFKTLNFSIKSPQA